jgi:hypothetical protein
LTPERDSCDDKPPSVRVSPDSCPQNLIDRAPRATARVARDGSAHDGANGRDGRRRIGYERRALFAYLLNGPSLVAIFLLAAYPIVYSGWISLHKYNLKRPRVFHSSASTTMPRY